MRQPKATSFLGAQPCGKRLPCTPVSKPPEIHADCVAWARTAGFRCETDESTDTLILRHDGGAPVRYFIRHRGARLQLRQASDDGDERIVLFAADETVLSVFLYGMFGDDIRDDLDLPFLELPWAITDLAHGYTLSDMTRGYRILSRVGAGPLAAAPDATLSLLTLVPLSQLLSLPSVDALRRSFLSEAGTPLLVDGRYALHK